jgi:hypothetical protein
MPLRLAPRVAAILAVGVIAGCADRLYEQRLIQPEGTTSQSCLDRCARLQEECEARQTVREQECGERAAASEGDKASCSGGGSGPCPPPESCLGADMSICQRQYEECFSDCGGRVERRLRPRPWETPPPATSSAAQSAG